LVVAGAVMQLGSGIINGFKNNASVPGGSSGSSVGDVKFRIQGKDLVGVMGRQNYYNNAVT